MKELNKNPTKKGSAMSSIEQRRIRFRKGLRQWITRRVKAAPQAQRFYASDCN